VVGQEHLEKARNRREDRTIVRLADASDAAGLPELPEEIQLTMAVGQEQLGGGELSVIIRHLLLLDSDVCCGDREGQDGREHVVARTLLQDSADDSPSAVERPIPCRPE
jgi:hypothetical protein